MTTERGELNHEAKLTAQQVRGMLRSRQSQRKLAKRLAVCKSLIGNIRRGEAWKHLGGKRWTDKAHKRRVKLTADTAARIRSNDSAWRRRHELAKAHGVTERSIRNLLALRTWKPS